MEFTRIPQFPQSVASARVIASTAPFVPAYATRPKGPRKLATDEMLTIDLRPDASLVQQAQYSASVKNEH